MPRHPPIGNLILIGFEEAARIVHRRSRYNKGGSGMVTIVDDAGNIATKYQHQVSSSNTRAAHIVGTFDSTSKIEQIEDDMLARLRELTSGITGIAA